MLVLMQADGLRDRRHMASASRVAWCGAERPCRAWFVQTTFAPRATVDNLGLMWA
jgi:hypothetical protein